MRIFSKIPFIVFIVGFAFYFIHWPGTLTSEVLSIIGISIFLIMVLCKKIKQKINKEINYQDLATAILLISLYLSLLNYSLFKVMYWLTGMHYFQIISFGLLLILITFFLGVNQIRKHVIILLKQWRVATFFAFISLLFMTIPHSRYIYWIEIKKIENSLQAIKCDGYGRYIGSLKREGKFDEAETFRNQINNLCE